MNSFISLKDQDVFCTIFVNSIKIIFYMKDDEFGDTLKIDGIDIPFIDNDGCNRDLKKIYHEIMCFIAAEEKKELKIDIDDYRINK